MSFFWEFTYLENTVGVGDDEGLPREERFVGLLDGVTGEPHLAGALKVRNCLGILQHARLGGRQQ